MARHVHLIKPPFSLSSALLSLSPTVYCCQPFMSRWEDRKDLLRCVTCIDPHGDIHSLNWTQQSSGLPLSSTQWPPHCWLPSHCDKLLFIVKLQIGLWSLRSAKTALNEPIDADVLHYFNPTAAGSYWSVKWPTLLCPHHICLPARPLPQSHVLFWFLWFHWAVKF